VAREATAIIFDPAGALGKAAELYGSIGHVPEPVGDRFEAHDLLGEDVADVDPGLLPADAVPKLSCGRSALNSARKVLKARCWAR
jgi:hypothetical protein